MGKGPKLHLSFLNSIQICRPNNPSTLVKNSLSLKHFPSYNSITYGISLPTLQSPPSSPLHHIPTKYNSKPCKLSTPEEASYSRTKREDTKDLSSSEEPNSMKQRRARTRRFKRYGSKDWMDGSTRKLENELLVEKPVSGRPGRCSVDGQVKESFVVMKRSVDPFQDFKKSMLEIILEREIFEPKDLEQLLMCFLSLNSRMHHRAILKAFSEIWKEVFSRPSN